jgi:predicted alpha/beta-hydrolase family hydrolase
MKPINSQQEIHEPGIQGLLNEAPKPLGASIVIAHGAGGNVRTAYLEKLALALAAEGVHALRIDLPYRQLGSGPPRPATAAKDRAGIRAALDWMRSRYPGKILAGGHSYGGRQTSMLAAEDASVADALLLTSYPLHPPGRPDQLRTAHWPGLRVPTFFASGSKDTFGTEEEMRSALPQLAARYELRVLPGEGHSLKSVSFVQEFLRFAGIA